MSSTKEELEGLSKWDLRYLKEPPNKKPLALLERYYTLSPNTKALDLACGMGRNAIFLASKGFSVDALDNSKVAISHLSATKGINATLQDLSTYAIPPSAYGLICKSHFLQRELFLGIIDGLVKNGVFIFETFLKDSSIENPVSERFLLQEGEVEQIFSPLEILFLQKERIEHRGRSATVLQMVAKKH